MQVQLNSDPEQAAPRERESATQGHGARKLAYLTIVASSIALVATALLILLSNAVPTTEPGSLDTTSGPPPESTPPAEHQAQVRVAEIRSPQHVEQAFREWLVIDEAGTAIEGAELFVRDPRSSSLEGSIAQSDSEGMLSVRTPLESTHRGQLVVQANGYLPNTDLSAATVVLRRGLALRGHATDREGRPVSGLRVYASRTVLPRGFPRLDASPATLASSPLAIFVATSAPDGSFHVFGLPQGEYFVEYQHDYLSVMECNTAPSARNNLASIDIKVVLGPTLAACVEVTGTTIVVARPSTPHEAVNHEHARRSRLNTLTRRGIREGWQRSRAHYFVTVGDVASAPRTMSIAIVPRGHEPMQVDVPLRPIDDETYHRVDPGPTTPSATVSIDFLDANNTPLPIDDLYLAREDMDATNSAIVERHSLSNGAPTMVSHGQFRVGTMNRMLAPHMDTNPIMIAGDSKITIRLTCAVGRVRVLSAESHVSECNIMPVGGPSHQRARFAYQGDGAFEFLLPPGSYTAAVGRHGFRTHTTTLTIAEGGGAVTISVPRLEEL